MKRFYLTTLDHKVEHKGYVWRVDFQVREGLFKIYRVQGDTSPQALPLLHEILQHQADCLGLRLALEVT